MLRSLRFQLPALFLLGVVVAGLVSAAIALRLFRLVRAEPLAPRRPTARLRQRGERADAALPAAGRAEAALAAPSSSSRPATASSTAGSILFPGRARVPPLPPKTSSTSARSGRAEPAHFDFRPPGSHRRAARGRRARCCVGSSVFGDDRRGEAGDGAQPALARADRAAADRVRRRRRSSRRRSPGTRRAGSRRRCCSSRRPPTRSRTATTTSRCRAAAPARSACSPSGSARWPRGSARPRSSSATS